MKGNHGLQPRIRRFRDLLAERLHCYQYDTLWKRFGKSGAGLRKYLFLLKDYASCFGALFGKEYSATTVSSFNLSREIFWLGLTEG